MRLVKESLNEYVSHAENRAADIEIDRWQAKQKGQNPLRLYINKVVKLIFNTIDERTIRRSGVSELIIDDLITSPIEEGGFARDIYDYYDNYIPEETAALNLKLEIENYIAGADNNYN